MAFKKKNYLKVGNIKLPRPPAQATHIKIHCAGKKHATVAIKDVETLLGTKGKLQYLRLHSKSRKLLESHAQKYKWDGEQVVSFKFDD
jgi:hypothetical protein